MESETSVRIMISGHTDNSGPARYNQNLSKSRADSVLEYFVKNGIDRKRFESKGFGYDQPLVSNDTPEGRRTNRRVEFSLID